MKKFKFTDFKLILQLCKFSLKANPFYHFLNFSIWLILSIIPIFTGLLIKNLFNNINFNDYMFNLFILASILVINIILTYLGGICDSNSRFYLGNYLRKNLLKYLLNNKDNISNSIKISLLNTDIDIIEEFISFTMDFINKLIYFIFAFIVLARINLLITVLLFSFIFISMFIIYAFKEKVKSLYINSRNNDFKNIELINKVINNHLLINFINSNSIINKVHNTYQERNSVNIKKHVFDNFLSTLTILFNNLIYIIIMLGIILLVNSNNRISDFTIFIEYSTYFIAYLSIFKEIFINFKSIQKFLSDIINKFEINKDNILSVFQGFDDDKIDFNNKLTISYKYQNQVNNFDVYKNDKIIIFNNNDLLLNIDNNINNYGLAIANDYLLDDTIINNISLYNKVNYHELETVIKVCELDDIDYLSNQKIGINGKKLSEGQRQRLIIARALYTNSNLVILDNCFSNIDSNRIIKIFNNLVDYKKTVIIIYYHQNDLIINNLDNKWKIKKTP